MRFILKKITISYKLFIIAIVLCIPIAIILYFMINSFNERIEISKNEIVGIKLIKPVEKIAELLPVYQELLLKNKHTNNNERFIDAEKQIDEAVAELAKISSDLTSNKSFYGGISDNSQIDIVVKNIQNKITVLRSKSKNMSSEDINKNIKDIMSSIILFIRDIGDASHLILDTDLDSYYLMDISVLVMPSIYERIIDINSIYCKICSNNNIVDIDKDLISFYSNSLEKDFLNRISRDISVSIREDERYYGRSITLQQNLLPLYEEYESSLKQYNYSFQKLAIDTSTAIKEDFMNAGFTLIKTSNNFWNGVNTELQILIENRISDFYYRLFIIIIISLVSIVLSLLLVIYISNGIVRPLRIIKEISINIAEGNILNASEKLKEFELKDSAMRKIQAKQLNMNKIKDEIYQLFFSVSKMTDNLENLLKLVTQSGSLVANTTKKISSLARDLEAIVTEQAASTNEVNATGREIRANSSELADTMSNLSKMTSETSLVARNGISNLNDIKNTMNSLLSSSNEISSKLDDISSKASDINNILITITKVANETNLLSLNASIEAEKAKEFGKGFSVVAREIKRLANETAISAINIEDMISKMILAVKNGVVTVSDYNLTATLSSEKITNMIDELSKIIEQMGELEPKFDSVNNGMQMQFQGSLQINEAMEQLNITAHQTSNSLHEFNSATEQLDEAVKSLQNEMQKFIINR